MVLNTAHRGFSGKYPENSLLAIQKAVQQGVDFVEIDVHLSKDQEVVVIHDRHLNRMTTGKGKISKKTLSEIKEHRLKIGNHHIPTLQEVFPLIKGKTKLNIEIKGIRPAWKVASLIKKYKMQDKVIVSSGSVNALRIIKNEIPFVKTAFIFYVSPGGTKQDFVMNLLSKLSFKVTQFMVLRFAELSKADYVHLAYPFATKSFIKRLKKRNYLVSIWVVNTPKLMRKMIKRGADGIITNRPDRLNKLILEKSKQKKAKRLSLKRINLKKINIRNINFKKVNLNGIKNGLVAVKNLGRKRKQKGL